MRQPPADNCESSPTTLRMISVNPALLSRQHSSRMGRKSKVSVVRTDLLCPNFEDHTPAPDGYIQWHAWAEQMSKTHRQDKCGGCGLYAIWVPAP